MARTLTAEDVELMRDTMRDVLKEGFAAVGMGYDTTEGQRALQADHQWMRSSRLNEENKYQQVRKGFLSLAILAAGVAILYCLEHLGAFVEMITKLFSSGVSQ